MVDSRDQKVIRMQITILYQGIGCGCFEEVIGGWGLGRREEGGGSIFGELSLFNHPNFWTFLHRKMGTTSFL
jgi:hypothetical protein